MSYSADSHDPQLTTEPTKTRPTVVKVLVPLAMIVALAVGIHMTTAQAGNGASEMARPTVVFSPVELNMLSSPNDAEVVILTGSEITDADVARLAKLPNLQLVNLSGSRVTDNGLRALANLKHLRYLHLADTAVTDAGLAHLRNLPSLERINVDGTAVTPAGLDQLQRVPQVIHTSNPTPRVVRTASAS
ncbi:MAG: hypothetical protein GC159_19635 [Phycisphaera sp.]|nr:hypothetical protein [Phycisphaera sp.]